MQEKILAFFLSSNFSYYALSKIGNKNNYKHSSYYTLPHISIKQYKIY